MEYVNPLYKPDGSDRNHLQNIKPDNNQTICGWLDCNDLVTGDRVTLDEYAKDPKTCPACLRLATEDKHMADKEWKTPEGAPKRLKGAWRPKDKYPKPTFEDKALAWQRQSVKAQRLQVLVIAGLIVTVTLLMFRIEILSGKIETLQSIVTEQSE